MGLSREATLKKNRAQGAPAWLTQAGELPNRLFLTPAEKELIDLLRKDGELTRAGLGSYTDYSRTKITASLDSLLQKGIIIENPGTEYTGGRRSKTFSLNGALGCVAGVAIGATSVHLALASVAGRVLARCHEELEVRQGPITVLGRVCDLLEQAMRQQKLEPGALLGIGVGIPGPVDFSNGTVVSPPIMPGWDRFPIIQTMQQWFPAACVVVDNDVNVMAIGEMAQGAGQGLDDLIFVKIGTGIGAGIICEGRIYRGASGCAGDVGHISVDKNGPLCHCGNRGCLEAMAGGAAIAERAAAACQGGASPILQRYGQAAGGELTARDVGQAAREGDPTSIEIIRESGQMIGDVLASLVNFYNPDIIVIGGGVSNLGNLLLSSIRQAVLRRSLPLATRDLHIVFSEIGYDAGVAGALTLAMDYLFSIRSGSSNGDSAAAKEMV